MSGGFCNALAYTHDLRLRIDSWTMEAGILKSESLSPMNNIKKTAIPPPRLGGRFSGPAPRLHHSGFRTFNDPVMTAADMQAELERLHRPT
jgi:hypothetical protein